MHLSCTLKLMSTCSKKIMSSHISIVLKQALTTFTCKQEVFPYNLQLLTSLLNKTTDEHVNLHPEFLTERLWKQPDKAPVTCVEIYEDNNLTMGIFIMKPGGKLPLHNHPEMYGLIKVIAGKVNITSYSINTEKTKAVDERSVQGSPISFPKFSRREIVTAELNDTITADVNSPTCILDPNNRNLHEIQSIDGPAAFLDILSPPYETLTPDDQVRHCKYYTKLSQVSSDIFRLQEIKSPSWYWTDCFPYTGPPLTNITVNSGRE